jgi:hypothetical protein
MKSHDEPSHPAAAPGAHPVPPPRTFARRIDCSPLAEPAVVPADDAMSGEGA